MALGRTMVLRRGHSDGIVRGLRAGRRDRRIPAVAQLVRALTELRFARTPLPSQLPPPPEIPHATLVMLATPLLADQLTFAEQRSLQRGLEDELERARSDEVREDVLSLMGKLRDRPEIAARVRDDIDKLLGSREAKR